jgi:HK97 gp10 family phage protein
MAETLIGEKHLQRILQQLTPALQRKLTRQSVSKALSPMVSAAKQKAPRESGLLKKSLGKKIKSYASRNRVVGIAGPRKETVGEYNGKLRRPVRYAHIVEMRHQPFMRPAFDATQSTMISIMKSELAEGVVREAAKIQ